ncbi:MAG: hypothetical protein ACI3ZK_02600 [Candidatus Cryptobacteroides sp.]
MRIKRIATILLCFLAGTAQIYANDWRPDFQNYDYMPSSGNWTYNYLIQDDYGTTTRLVNTVLAGVNTDSNGVREVILTGDVCLRHSVFVGISTVSNVPTTLIIKNGTDNVINFWDDLDNPNDDFGADNFMVLFSVWEGCTLIIDGDPDGNGKGKIVFGGNNNHRGLVTKYGFIESTGNLELKDVIIEHVKFDETNANAGECSVLKIHPWVYGSTGYYEQGYTKLTNTEIRHITMPGGVGSVMYCYLTSQNKENNNREKCTITMKNVNIHDVSQGSNSNDGNGGLIRFRGDWVGNLHMTGVNIHDCTSGASGGGVYWNALGRSSEPCEMVLNGCTFQNLQVTNGNAGALLIEGRARFIGDTTKFIGNSCTYPNEDSRVSFGGAVYIHNYSSTDTPPAGESFSYNIDKAVFQGNSADHGGGLAIRINDEGNLPEPTNFYVNVNGAKFLNNTASAEAGALKIDLGTTNKKYYLSLNLNSGVFDGNSAKDGGAIYSWRGNVAYDADGSCEFYNNTASNNGSAIYVNASPIFQLKNATINNNTTTGHHGAVYVTNTTSMIMENGYIHDNLANEYGGGIYLVQSTMTMNNGRIENNNAQWRGGGVYLDNSTLTINNGQINSNTVGMEFGGGVCAYDSKFSMGNGEINGNSTRLNGGGIYLLNSTFDFNNGHINQNEVTLESGGGVCAIASDFNMTDGEINGNSAKLHGGGIYYGNNKGGTANEGVANRRFSFSGGSISGNTSGGFGGGVCLYTGSQDGCTFNLTGGEINDNTAEAGGGVYLNGWAKYTMNLTNTNVQNNTAYMGGGVMVYNANLYYKNGLIRYNRAIQREGNTVPATMYQVNHSLWDADKKEDYVNASLSGIGGGLYATWGKVNFDTSEGKFGIYSNLADFGADDIFTNAKDCSINLPDPTTMTVVGFDVPAANQFWAQDYIKGDTNYDKRPSSALEVINQNRYRVLLNDLDANLATTKIPAGTYTEYICATLGYCFAPVKIVKKGLLPGETAIINFYHMDVNDGHSEQPYMQMAILNDTGKNDAEITKYINLRPGTWTLVETNWAWSYYGKAEGSGSKTVDGQAAITRYNLLDTSTDEERTFTFDNKKNDTTNPAKESVKTNVMTPLP